MWSGVAVRPKDPARIADEDRELPRSARNMMATQLLRLAQVE